MPTNNMGIKILGLNIKAERNRKNLSQERLAELIKMTCRSISKIETGAQKPRAVTVYNNAKTLKISIKELFKGIE